ncbi:CHAT domain-containing protein [Ruegeria pomeroyi]|nr:CHAT domain-containing protein [Ruegeria pomeroyi]NVL03301.1 CHAT domain-containing protein [Ruegeria pomeroyi]
MALGGMTKITWQSSESFEVEEAGTHHVRRGGLGQGADDPLTGLFAQPEVRKVFEVVEAQRHVVRPTKRSAGPNEIAVRLDVDDGADYILAVRHPSGAIQFIGGQEIGAGGKRSNSALRTRRTRNYAIEFRAPISFYAEKDVRRGIVGDIKDAVVDAIVIKVKDFIAKKTVDLAEAAIWKLLGREPGMKQLSIENGRLNLAPVSGRIKPGPNGRALLFIHGTFSTTDGSFGDLASAEFFGELARTYGNAIYGFDHYSVSVTPEKNASDILKTLPSGGIDCDVVTHSRGGLVLRTLNERQGDLSQGKRFRLQRAALVACPNEGTQLATPDRWQGTLGWLANLLDLFPPNPITSNAALVMHWVTWFAKVGVAAAEGLDAMNMTGAQIRQLQSPPSPAPGQYSALVSNCEPNGKLWARALDLGIDWFFDEANDLVVPTSGGWRIDRVPDFIPKDQIGAYGPGGNIPAGPRQVTHISFFDRAETLQFVLRALSGAPQHLPELDLARALPVSRSADGAVLPAMAEEVEPQVAELPAFETVLHRAEAAAPRKAPARRLAAHPNSSVFELIVLDPEQITRMGFPRVEEEEAEDGHGTPFLYAAYGGARVMVPFYLKKAHLPPKTGNETEDKRLKSMAAEMGQRWGKLFGFHRRVQSVLDGNPRARELSPDELRIFGELLFETLLPQEVRRLYDVARSREHDKLFVIFTSMIHWVFDMPWEFARDPERGTYLATEDVHFIRNVLTQTPVEKLSPRESLKILIATSEPRDQRRVSATEEIAKLRKAITELQRDGLIEFEIRKNATPRNLHHEIATGNYDVVHFIGHGYWNTKSGESGLVLEDETGNSRPLGGRPLREILSGRGIRLVFLNACDTGRSRRASGVETTSLAGVAQDLFGRGVPNVVANQFPVGDNAAVAFARTIYEYLAHGKTIAQSVREARISANYEKDGQSMDWAIPVAYARDPEDRLVVERKAAGGDGLG